MRLFVCFERCVWKKIRVFFSIHSSSCCSGIPFTYDCWLFSDCSAQIQWNDAEMFKVDVPLSFCSNPKEMLLLFPQFQKLLQMMQKTLLTKWDEIPHKRERKRKVGPSILLNLKIDIDWVLSHFWKGSSLCTHSRITFLYKDSLTRKTYLDPVSLRPVHCMSRENSFKLLR